MSKALCSISGMEGEWRWGGVERKVERMEGGKEEKERRKKGRSLIMFTSHGFSISLITLHLNIAIFAYKFKQDTSQERTLFFLTPGT